MPTNKKQKTMACMALAMADGKMKESYSAQAAKMMKSMSKEKLTEWCKGPMMTE